jgi:hypothetical protein
MKKLIFVFVFALLGTCFQSAKAQTFSRVVTVTKNLDQTECFQRRYQIDTLFVVPNGKIFKIELLQGSSEYAQGSREALNIFINGSLYNDIKNTSIRRAGSNQGLSIAINSSSFWLKSGDIISFQIWPNSDCQVFLSGIEYDAQ